MIDSEDGRILNPFLGFCGAQEFRREEFEDDAIIRRGGGMDNNSLALSRGGADIVPKIYWMPMNVFNDIVTHGMADAQKYAALDFSTFRSPCGNGR